MASRLAVLPVVALAAALAGCGGGSSDSDSSSAPADTGTGAAASSAAPNSADSGSSDAGGGSSEAAPSQSTSSEAPSSSSESSSAASSTVGGNGAEPAEVEGMAKKLGCSTAHFQNTKPNAPAAKVGSKGGVQCIAGSKGYFVISVTKGNESALARSLKTATGSGGSLPYLKGDGWMVLGTDDVKSKTAKFSKSVVEDAKRKIGSGTITSL